MSAPRKVGIRGTGSFVPEKVLGNEELEKMVDTTDEWITSRTGIKERRIASSGETTSTMGAEAARRAIDSAGITAEEVDLIIVATVTGDQVFPSTACHIQRQLGAGQIGAFDIQAACSGYVYALATAHAFVASGSASNVLVVGAETLSRMTDYSDRASCILFGDGAGAAIISDRFERGEILSTSLHSEGDGADVIQVVAGGTAMPTTVETVEAGLHYMQIRGREVYKFAVLKMVGLVKDAQEKHSDLTLGYVLPHQVNLRIIESAREKLELRSDQVFVNIDRMGNTSAASIAIGLDEASRGGLLDPVEGQLLVMCAFGAGLTWGSVSVRW